MAKIKVGLIYGGESFEHEVSLMTAESIRKNIDRDKFEVIDIFISKKGELDEKLLDDIDIAFLAVHGPNCEDGKLQKFLEDRGVKYTGPGINASRINMDKIRMHNIHRQNGLPVVEYQGFDERDIQGIKNYCREIGYPVFVKPNNTGSSVGISKVTKESELEQAVNLAFEYDSNICIEKGVSNHREYEIGILGNGGNDLLISDPGEVLVNGGFYSYETKYIKPFDTITNVPDMTVEKKNEIKSLGKKAYLSTNCRGYSRIDFLADGNGKIYVSEISTLPGFTKISMFPKLMAEMRISYKDLITKIIELGLEDAKNR